MKKENILRELDDDFDRSDVLSEFIIALCKVRKTKEVTIDFTASNFYYTKKGSTELTFVVDKSKVYYKAESKTIDWTAINSHNLIEFLDGQIGNIDDSVVELSIDGEEFGFDVSMIPSCCGAYLVHELMSDKKSTEVLLVCLEVSRNSMRKRKEKDEYTIQFTHQCKSPMYKVVKDSDVVTIVRTWKNRNSGQKIFLAMLNPAHKKKKKESEPKLR